MSGQADPAASPAPAPPAATPLPTGSLAGHTLGTQSLPGCDMAAQGSSGTTGSATTLPTAPTPLQLPSVIATSAPTPSIAAASTPNAPRGQGRQPRAPATGGRGSSKGKGQHYNVGHVIDLEQQVLQLQQALATATSQAVQDSTPTPPEVPAGAAGAKEPQL